MTAVESPPRRSSRRASRSVSRCPAVDLTVLLVDGDSHLALQVVRCLGQVPGLRVYVACRRTAMPVRFSRHCRLLAYPPAQSARPNLEDIRSAIARTAADVVMAIDERAVRLLSAQRHEIEDLAALAPVPETTTFDVLTDKWSFANFLVDNRLPTPATHHWSKIAAWDELETQLSFPILIKPRHRRNGDGIKKFTDFPALRAHLKQLREDEIDDLIFQSYIPGDDIDCSLLCRDGEIVAHTIQTGFIPRAGTFMAPAGIHFIHDSHVYDIARELVSAAKFSGVAHLDMRRSATDGSLKVIEANLRYWASLLGSLAAGVNFPYLACLAALGRTITAPAFDSRKFVDTTPALRHWIRRGTRNPQQTFTFAETGICYALRDPLAEVAKWVHHIVD